MNKNTISVELDLEAETGSEKEFSKLETQAIKMIERYTNKQEKILARVSKEVTESSYEQSSYKPDKKDFDSLREQLILKSIYAFEDGLVITFDAPVAYPDYEISVQLTRLAAVDDISLNEKD